MARTQTIILGGNAYPTSVVEAAIQRVKRCQHCNGSTFCDCCNWSDWNERSAAPCRFCWDGAK